MACVGQVERSVLPFEGSMVVASQWFVGLSKPCVTSRAASSRPVSSQMPENTVKGQLGKKCSLPREGAPLHLIKP